MFVGLNGEKGAGKDTVGLYLAENYGFERLSFAAKLKESAAELFDLPIEVWEDWKNNEAAIVMLKTNSGVHAKLTVRQFLQRYGTEAHRDVFGYDFWVDALFRDIHPDNVAYYNYCITDARFENELQRIQNEEGFNIRIERSEVKDGDQHISEQEPPAHLIDYKVWNNSSFEDLYKQIDFIMEKRFIKKKLHAHA